MTELCGIVLHPSGHTLSPLLHEEAYRELGLDAVYRVFDVPPGGLETFVRGLQQRRIRQLSVSLPHKEDALGLAESSSEEARRIGAANTLTRTAEGLRADNTDWLGVVRTLEPFGPWRGHQAVVIGAGGAARAVVYALVKLGVQVRVVNRTRERAQRLASELGASLGDLDAPYDLLIHATPVGMDPNPEATPVPTDALRPGALVFDAVYRPLETRLLREARTRGCRTVDGLRMLVHQAREQIRIWSGISPSFDHLYRIARESL